MPVMDGIEATRLLREQGYRTPVYALTANVMVKHREQFYQVGCDGFIAKPIDKSALQEVLRKHLQDGSTEGKRQAGLKMEPIEWHNDYAIGHPQIDSDHQAVVKGINALVHYCLREQQEGSREDVLMELSALHEVLFRHLQMEEELLRKSGYPQLTSHIESHHEYGGRLAQLYKSKLDDRKIEAMTTVLLGWWKHHILVEDLAYREHLQGWMQRHGEVQRHVVSRGEAEAEVDEELMAIFQQSATENRQQLKQALTQENWQRVKELAHSIKGSGASFGFPQLSEKAKVACDHYDQGELGVMPHAVQQLIDELDVVLR
jgi:hemerythrin-like metal-binding protein